MPIFDKNGNAVPEVAAETSSILKAHQHENCAREYYQLLPPGNYEQETAKMLIGAFKDCKVLPKGCSPNGDLITKQQAIDIVEFYQMNPQHFNFVNVIDEIKDEKPVIAALQFDPGMSMGRMM